MDANSLRASLVFVAALAAPVVSSKVRAADGGTACGDAFDQSQVSRDHGQLLEARRLLRLCGEPSCSPTERRLCAEWLLDVDARMPSFILAARDGSGSDLVDVRVSMDGAPIATTLDGRAVEVDPGPHSLLFERADGTKAQAMAVANERGKGKVVSVTFVPALPKPIATAAPATQTTTSHAGSPLRSVGFATGAAGIAGLAVGAVFGMVALSTKSGHCDADNLCQRGYASTVSHQATLSTFGFVAGGTLLAGGVALVLLAPRGSGEPAASVAVAPLAGPFGAGLQLAGHW